MHFIVDIFTTMLYNLHVVILMNKTILPIGKTPMVQIEYKYKGKINYSSFISSYYVGAILQVQNQFDPIKSPYLIRVFEYKNKLCFFIYNIYSVLKV